MQQVSIIDIVPLAFLVLFFGIQQRGRRRLSYRYWFVGWICVLLSYLAWGMEASGRPVGGLAEAARLDLLLVAVLVFLASSVAQDPRLRPIVLTGLLVGVPGVAAINLQTRHGLPKWLMLASVLAWDGYGIYAARALLKAKHTFRCRLIVALCLGWGAAMSVDIWRTDAGGLSEWTLAQIFLCAAVLYGMDHGRRTLAGVMGTVGFTAWGTFYAIVPLTASLPTAFAVLNKFWNLPKYLVAFSMILKIFEDARDEESRLAEESRAMYEDFRLVFDNNPHPALIYAEGTGQFLLANRAAVECYGYSEEEFLSLRMEEIEVAPDEESEALEAMVSPMTEGTRGRVRHRNGHPVWVNIKGDRIRYQDMDARLVIVRDVSRRVQIDLDMVRRANHDALTGLPNRRLLEDRMEQALAKAVRDNRKMAVFSIDIDHFKKVNDAHGHMVGDACLKAVAERLSSKIRSVDTLARVGGEEFVAVIGGLGSVANAERIAQDLLRLFEAPIALSECELGVTVSIGLAVFPDDGYEAETLYRSSDAALYAAKQAGRNRYVYTRAMDGPQDAKGPGGVAEGTA